MRDIRMLRKFLDRRIPEVTSNDAEQLKALLTKCRRNMQQDCRDFPEDAQMTTTNSPPTGINLNVSFSPVHNSNSCTDSVHVPEAEKKVKHKRSKRKKKRSRRSSSSSDSSSSDSESEHSHTRRKVCKSKRKIPFQQEDFTVLPPPYNPYLGQLGAGQYLPFMHESTSDHFSNMCYPFQTPFLQTQRISNQRPFNQQLSLGNQNIQNDITSPMVQAFNYRQNNSFDAAGPHTQLEDRQQESTALGLLVDAAISSNNDRH